MINLRSSMSECIVVAHILIPSISLYGCTKYNLPFPTDIWVLFSIFAVTNSIAGSIFAYTSLGTGALVFLRVC